MGVMRKFASLTKKKQQQEKEDVRQRKETETLTWRRLKNLFSTSNKWKRVEILQTEIVDGVVYKVLYVIEALVLVSTLCVFYVCCGCHF